MVLTELNAVVVAGGATSAVVTQPLPAKYNALSTSILSAYNATAATTGVKLQVSASLDDGATYSDFSDVVTTAPTASSASAVHSQKNSTVSVPAGTTHVQLRAVNLDATNSATVTVGAKTV